MASSSIGGRLVLGVAGLSVVALLAALPWFCLKAGLLVHVGKPAFGLLVAADALVASMVLWRVATGRS
jgi:hypothetical protein